jgi:hypothetical protein
MSTAVPPASEIARALISLRYSSENIAGLTKSIYDAILRDSAHLRQGNFTRISTADLSLLFDLYDGGFFSGGLRQLLQAAGAPLTFHLSARLTRAAGTTKRFRTRRAAPGATPAQGARYEIALSTTLLGQTFQDVQRTIRVNGLVCHDRLQAAQRVFEHELLHLLEMLVWGKSSCSAGNFKALALNLFAHTETRHDLVTQQERARARFDLRVGDRVAFDLEGQRHVGTLRRITKRATVLVESADGAPYTDGKRYRKFYVPLPLLRKPDGEAPT